MDTLNTDAAQTRYRVSFSFMGNVVSSNPKMLPHKHHLAALYVVGTAHSCGDAYFGPITAQGPGGQLYSTKSPDAHLAPFDADVASVPSVVDIQYHCATQV